MGSDPCEGLASVALLPRKGEAEDGCEQHCDRQFLGGPPEGADGGEDRVVNVDLDPECSWVTDCR